MSGTMQITQPKHSNALSSSQPNIETIVLVSDDETVVIPKKKSSPCPDGTKGTLEQQRIFAIRKGTTNGAEEDDAPCTSVPNAIRSPCIYPDVSKEIRSTELSNPDYAPQDASYRQIPDSEGDEDDDFIGNEDFDFNSEDIPWDAKQHTLPENCQRFNPQKHVEIEVNELNIALESEATPDCKGPVDNLTKSQSEKRFMFPDSRNHSTPTLEQRPEILDYDIRSVQKLPEVHCFCVLSNIDDGLGFASENFGPPLKTNGNYQLVDGVDAIILSINGPYRRSQRSPRVY